MNKLQTICDHIEPGVLKMKQKDRFTQALTTMPLGSYSLKLEKLFGKRSNNQNSYYWAVVMPIVLEGLQEIGYDADDVEEAHEVVKKLFIKPTKKRKRIVNKITGEMMYIQPILTTTKMSTVEFNAYIEKVARWAAEFLGVVIPEPDPNYKIM